ncbi:MAG: family 16 glycosylhydrolase [Anaerolineae bacterium]|nr:family 16 glycosylhydrolase [Anaerolineae bacterium]
MLYVTDFRRPLTAPWRVTEIGAGVVEFTPGAAHLRLPAGLTEGYHDAQISDYAGRADFRWRPPARMTVRAHFRGDALRGTAGFGFWNHPFVPGERGFRLPQTAWFFFGAPPGDIALAQGVPGAGWKAATLDATRSAFLLLAPTAPLGFLLMRVPMLYRCLWPLAQRAVGVSECLLDPALMHTTHEYRLDWERDHITFYVDGAPIHRTPSAPRGPLGFIAWIDNQYAIVTPQGRFGFGVSRVEQEQVLMLENVRVEGLLD